MDTKQINEYKKNIFEADLDIAILFPDEITYFSEINHKLNDALKKAENNVKQIDKEYKDTKRYMAEYRSEIDPHEMFQSELLLKQTDTTGAFVAEMHNKLVKLKESPYFARIDFCDKDSKESAKYYIGRFSFSYENELLIFDWRTPVASMFYDYELGPADYEAPIGKIDGELTKKRQFKIKNGVIEYILESSAHIQDDILQKELSHTSDEKMKSIISTIQKEQNQIIRNEKAKTLIIQGVAGSGKTSIALHRIAFLLYRFKNQLSAQNITIISPNKVFGDYISNVIPELGEEPIFELSLVDIAEIQLEHIIQFELDKDPLESYDKKWIERVRFKSTLEFVTLMNEYIKQLPDRIFVPKDYTFDGFTVKSEWIQKRFQAYSRYPVKKRLSMVAEDIHNYFQTNNNIQYEIPKTKVILKSLISMLTIKNSLSLYKDFYKKMSISELLVMPQKNTLEWADVYPFLYLHSALEDLKENKITKHLVIDEMQDYTPIQYAVINQLFPCQKTILGDFGQFINPNHLHTLEDLKQLYQNAEFVMLNKSYRSTYEIINFAKHIQNTVLLEAVERHGDKPAILSYENKHDEIQHIKKAICNFEAGKSTSLGIVVKTNTDAEMLYDILSQDCNINFISPKSTSFKNGASITSIQMSKGLEFDEVIIPDVNNDNYKTNYDKNLLYIACTRAMHKLILMYTGQLSCLITE